MEPHVAQGYLPVLREQRRQRHRQMQSAETLPPSPRSSIAAAEAEEVTGPSRSEAFAGAFEMQLYGCFPPPPSQWPIGHSIGNEATPLFSGPVMAPPDLTSAVERGVYFDWLLGVVPGTSADFYANQLILQADTRDDVWFASDDAPSATWRPGWWSITQVPNVIRVCFAWRDGLRPIERAYVRHPQFHF